ncbi:thiol-disulfide oxidoreductase DCC family protein [Roseobacteraceae bacterium S113]
MTKSDAPAAQIEALCEGRDVVVFDGVCVLCNGFYHFIAKRDRRGAFHFATAQGATGQGLFKALDLPTEAFETFIVVSRGQVHTKSRAFAEVMSRLGGPWRLLSAIRLVPRGLADPLYDLVARNRYRLFGRRDTCMVPDPGARARFLP